MTGDIKQAKVDSTVKGPGVQRLVKEGHLLKLTLENPTESQT